MATAPRWLNAISKAIALPENKGQIVYQLATVDANNRPHVRTCVHRGIVQPTDSPNLPIILISTDVRSPKVAQLRANPQAEIAWWLAGSRDQFRIYGSVRVVPSPHASPDARISGTPSLALDKMDEQGYDWEKKRMEVFDNMSTHMKASWCRPAPGSAIDSYEVMRNWPQTVPKAGDENSEEDKQNQEKASQNIALVLIEVLEVDWVQLGITPNQRTRFIRKGEEWVEEIVAP